MLTSEEAEFRNQAGGILDRSTLISLDCYWRKILRDYDMERRQIYKGKHYMYHAPDHNPNWAIWKYTYDVAGNLVLTEGPITGAWENRTDLDWE